MEWVRLAVGAAGSGKTAFQCGSRDLLDVNLPQQQMEAQASQWHGLWPGAQLKACIGPVSYTHLRAHETRRHL
eukprot:11454435-Prorocentrum_lima.AAC.1